MNQFQILISGYVDREGMPETIDAWPTEDLSTLAKLIVDELHGRGWNKCRGLVEDCVKTNAMRERDMVDARTQGKKR